MSNQKQFTRVLLTIALAACHNLYAQQAPGAGSQIQQITQPPAPAKAAPEISIEKTPGQSSLVGDATKITVRSLSITGAKAFSTDELTAKSGFMANSELNLAELRSLAERISQYYQSKGYFLAQAYLPPQKIQDGRVTIAVLEGQYGQIKLNNGSKLSSALAGDLLAGLNSGDAINTATLETRLLLLNDVPGVIVKSTLVPGASVGAADLIVNVTPGQSVTGLVDADNSGNRYTGKDRVGGSINANNPFGLGDVASLRAVSSGRGLNYLRAAYQAQLGRAKLGASYARLNYRLGDSFSSLDASGTANITSVFGSYPLLRSRTSNLSAQLSYDNKALQDKVNGGLNVSDKRIRVLTSSLVGDFKDSLGGGASNNYSLSLSSGKLDIQSAAALAADAAAARANGGYTKIAYSGSRLQSLTPGTALYASVRGQIASKNLDSSEKIGLGGVNGVRAYPEGEAYSDEGYVATLELRTNIAQATTGSNGQLTLIGFVDAGAGNLSKNQFVAANANKRNLGAVGLGLNWLGANNLIVKAYYAQKLGSGPATSEPDSKGRFWLQAVKYF